MSVFLKAINIINDYGWGKRHYHNPANGSYCIVGACAKAADVAPHNWEDSKDWHKLAMVTDGSPVSYNDTTIHTKEGAIEILRKAYEYECVLAKQTEQSSAPQA